MIFLTVGTQFPFDRLVKCIDEFISRNGFEEEIFAQVGETSYRPRNFDSIPFLEQQVFNRHIRRASGIISHAGIGSIMMALSHRKPLLVMPRLKKHGEVVNDHQVMIAKRFEELGHILVAYDERNIATKINELRSFVPRPRKNQAETVSARISDFLDEISESTKQL